MPTTRAWAVNAARIIIFGLGWLLPVAATAQVEINPPPPSLKTVPVPEPTNLAEFVKNKPAAIALGKALFWEMQVGSDGVACASCHFHAGADNRTRNQVNPGSIAGDRLFEVVAGANASLTSASFPFTRHADPENRFSPLLFDANDIGSSQGVKFHAYYEQHPRMGSGENGAVLPDAIYNVGGRNVRRVEPRQAPTVINAVFNYANFWDGRANHIFNGTNAFGDADPDAGVYVSLDGAVVKQRVSIDNASLASQALAPPGSNTEMSFDGRTFPEIGRKLLAVTPLARQRVHPNDSVLRPFVSRQGKGLATTYEAMIRNAFVEKFWEATRSVTIGTKSYTQMEANFSLFFGLAIQLYEATLVSDDAPFDRFQEGNPTAMSASAQAGMNIFLTDVGTAGAIGGGCINCHGGPEFTNATIGRLDVIDPDTGQPEALIEHMIMASGASFYDLGYYNIGVRPTAEDPGRGGADPFGFPLSFTARAQMVNSGIILPFSTPPFISNGVIQSLPDLQSRTATAGAFKTPTCRNVELTGPYFHNGGAATLMQVVDHYIRGATFHERNIRDLAPGIETLTALQGNETAQRQLIDFLLALTDERVRWERAPFDHPELFIPHGAEANAQVIVRDAPGQVGNGSMIHLAPVGAQGRSKPIGTFLNLDPRDP